MKINKRPKFKGMTVLEVLIAITVFSMFFLLVMDFFKNSIQEQSITDWKGTTKQKLALVLQQVRQDFEKASYPCAVFQDGTVIFDGTSAPADADANDSDPGTQHYMKYFDGIVMGAGGASQKLLEWRICTPKYDNSIKDFMSNESWAKAQSSTGDVLCTLSAVTKDGLPQLLYENSHGKKLYIVGLKEVEVRGREIKPPGYEEYKTATYGSGEKKYNPWDDDGIINLRIVMSPEFTHGVKYGNAQRVLQEEKVTLKSGIKIISL